MPHFNNKMINYTVYIVTTVFQKVKKMYFLYRTVPYDTNIFSNQATT
jgi:hypothetical protein